MMDEDDLPPGLRPWWRLVQATVIDDATYVTPELDRKIIRKTARWIQENPDHPDVIDYLSHASEVIVTAYFGVEAAPPRSV
jgi:hypothetical protein